ncbi:hypothetical protein ANT_03240 [Anaerolinea thermophila UNI-1]|uniref:Uncharacterized protein n=1 Tax=Anaerolinea thermophila (strain DSM 14523 / JCM 11388 / NBRC 100420 / UNI-1) TaxID=926569 RepID=E8N023_ANATU|nr:hypothetical protein ANT_03240 [Anaerolinea thermophila UNI-1]
MKVKKMFSSFSLFILFLIAVLVIILENPLPVWAVRMSAGMNEED